LPPCADEPAGLAASVVVVLAAVPWLTTKVTVFDVDPVNDDDPLGMYSAVRLCVPTPRADVVNTAVPPESVTVFSTVVPSRNSIVPNAFDGETVAVIVTEVPDATGLAGDTASVVVVELVGCTTVSDTVLDVEDMNAVGSVGVNVAFNVCVPTDSVLMPNVAVPAETVPTPIWVLPSKNATWPAAVFGETVAVMVTGVPALTGLDGETPSVVVVGVADAAFTVYGSVDEVDEVNAVESVGVNVALSECDPSASTVLTEAVPEATV
jgi:hypothetical protein